MTDDEHDEEEEFPNMFENSNEEPEEQPNDYVVDFGGHSIYYCRDPDGKLNSREFLEEELCPDEEGEKEAEWPDFLEEELLPDEESEREAEQLKKKPIFRFVQSTGDTATLHETRPPAALVSVDIDEQRDIDADGGPQLHFSRAELDRNVAHCKTGLAKKSQDWINRSFEALWDCTRGEISHRTMKAL